MEERIVTKTQKGKGVQVQNQGDADRFFDVHRIVHAEFLPQGLNINQQVYKKHLATSDALSEGEKKRTVGKRPWLLHHDNAPAYNAMGIR